MRRMHSNANDADTLTRSAKQRGCRTLLKLRNAPTLLVPQPPSKKPFCHLYNAKRQTTNSQLQICMHISKETKTTSLPSPTLSVQISWMRIPHRSVGNSSTIHDLSICPSVSAPSLEQLCLSTTAFAVSVSDRGDVCELFANCSKSVRVVGPRYVMRLSTRKVTHRTFKATQAIDILST